MIRTWLFIQNGVIFLVYKVHKSQYPYLMLTVKTHKHIKWLELIKRFLSYLYYNFCIQVYCSFQFCCVLDAALLILLLYLLVWYAKSAYNFTTFWSNVRSILLHNFKCINDIGCGCTYTVKKIQNIRLLLLQNFCVLSKNVQSLFRFCWLNLNLFTLNSSKSYL